MSITLHLSSTLEARLQATASQQGKQVETIALELLTHALQPVSEPSALRVRNQIKEMGDFRPFAEFKLAQTQKYNLP